MIAEFEHVNRMVKTGFKKYFSQRQEHFWDVYRYEYTDENAEIAYRESKILVKKCKSGNSAGLLGENES